MIKKLDPLLDFYTDELENKQDDRIRDTCGVSFVSYCVL